MKLYSRFELASKPTPELHGLYRDLADALAVILANDTRLRNNIASLENIRRELAERSPGF